MVWYNNGSNIFSSDDSAPWHKNSDAVASWDGSVIWDALNYFWDDVLGISIWYTDIILVWELSDSTTFQSITSPAYFAQLSSVFSTPIQATYQLNNAGSWETNITDGWYNKINNSWHQ